MTPDFTKDVSGSGGAFGAPIKQTPRARLGPIRPVPISGDAHSQQVTLPRLGQSTTIAFRDVSAAAMLQLQQELDLADIHARIDHRTSFASDEPRSSIAWSDLGIAFEVDGGPLPDHPALNEKAAEEGRDLVETEVSEAEAA